MSRPVVLESKFGKPLQHETDPSLFCDFNVFHILGSRLCSFRI